MRHHPYITDTPLRTYLRAQLARLNRVIAESLAPDRVAQARRHAIKISHWIDNETDAALECAAGSFACWAPTVDDICRHVEQGGRLVRFVEQAPCGLLRDAA